MKIEDVAALLDDYQDWPRPGIVFKDLLPVLSNPEALKLVTDELASIARKLEVDCIFAPEARGFLFGVPVAAALSLPFIPARRPNKLPGKLHLASYELEYGVNEMAVQCHAFGNCKKALIIDDLLATGGTVMAMKELASACNVEVIGFAFVVELRDLHARNALDNVFSLIEI